MQLVSYIFSSVLNLESGRNSFPLKALPSSSGLSSPAPAVECVDGNLNFHPSSAARIKSGQQSPLSRRVLHRFPVERVGGNGWFGWLRVSPPRDLTLTLRSLPQNQSRIAEAAVFSAFQRRGWAISGPSSLSRFRLHPFRFEGALPPSSHCSSAALLRRRVPPCSSLFLRFPSFLPCPISQTLHLAIVL